MKYSDFHADLEYSLEERENEMFDAFYYRVFPGLKLIEFAEDMETQRKGIDKILHFESGRQVTIDEKKRREDYGDILLELWGVWEKRKRGWLHTCQCDYIIYAVMPSRKVYLLPSILLKRAWLTNRLLWKPPKYREVVAHNPGYTTKNIAIPTQELLAAITNEMTQTFMDARGSPR